MKDFNLRLEEGVALDKLVIVPVFDKYNELLQRAVSLVVLHTDDKLSVNGVHLMDLVAQTTTASIQSLPAQLSVVADNLKNMLNDEEDSVSAVSFYTESVGSTINFYITVTANGDTASALIKSYE